jgi:hypothetical protein
MKFFKTGETVSVSVQDAPQLVKGFKVGDGFSSELFMSPRKKLTDIEGNLASAPTTPSNRLAGASAFTQIVTQYTPSWGLREGGGFAFEQFSFSLAFRLGDNFIFG